MHAGKAAVQTRGDIGMVPDRVIGHTGVRREMSEGGMDRVRRAFRQ